MTRENERYSNCPNPVCGEPRYAGIDHVCHSFCSLVDVEDYQASFKKYDLPPTPRVVCVGDRAFHNKLPFSGTIDTVGQCTYGIRWDDRTWSTNPHEDITVFSGASLNEAAKQFPRPYYTKGQVDQMIGDALKPIREAIADIRKREPAFYEGEDDILTATEVLRSAGKYGALAARAFNERNELRKQNDFQVAYIKFLEQTLLDLARRQSVRSIIVPIKSDAIAIQGIQNS